MNVERALEALRRIQDDTSCDVEFQASIAIEELTKPCEQCGGDGRVGDGEDAGKYRCPNKCVDGRVPIT